MFMCFFYLVPQTNLDEELLCLIKVNSLYKKIILFNIKCVYTA